VRALYRPQEAVNVALAYYDRIFEQTGDKDKAFAHTIHRYGMKVESLAHALNQRAMQRDETQAVLAGEPVEVPDTFPPEWA